MSIPGTRDFFHELLDAADGVEPCWRQPRPAEFLAYSVPRTCHESERVTDGAWSASTGLKHAVFPSKKW